MRKFGLTLVSAMALLATGAASAADLSQSGSTKDPVTSSFSIIPHGFYITLEGGGTVGAIDLSGANAMGSIGQAGVLGRVRVGYDFQQSNWVVGPFIGGTFEDVKGDMAKIGSGSTSVNQVLGFETGLRGGYSFNGTLVYALAGYQWQHIGIDNTKDGTNSLSGVIVGGGVEIPVTKTVFLKTEIDGVWYEPWSPTQQIKLSNEELRGTVGVGLRF
jgi:opacity protein-like surface antigen